MDKAHRQTDKILNKVDREIGRVYRTDSALKHIEKKYREYMAYVAEETQDLYDDYVNETDDDMKQQKKATYANAVKKLTIQSKVYKKLIKEITKTLADVNQRAIDVSNDQLVNVYAINYNQVAEQCKKLGIRVDG